jgi:spore germination cell wall hydrolase CwlJ-like protein
MTRLQRIKIKRQVQFVLALILLCVIMLGIIIFNIIHIVKLKNKEPEIITKTQVQTQVVEKPVEVIVEIEKEPNYTYDELYCMAVAIYNEAGGNNCTDQHREYVGYVILNRINNSRFPDTIREVLEQPGQYESLGEKGINFTKRASCDTEAEALERAWNIAKKVLENRNNIPIPKNVVFQAEFQQGVSVYTKIGNTYFCCSK